MASGSVFSWRRYGCGANETKQPAQAQEHAQAEDEQTLAQKPKQCAGASLSLCTDAADVAVLRSNEERWYCTVAGVVLRAELAGGMLLCCGRGSAGCEWEWEWIGARDTLVKPVWGGTCCSRADILQRWSCAALLLFVEPDGCGAVRSRK